VRQPHPIIAELKEERLRAGLTRPQVAQQLYMSEPALYGREAGKYEPSTLADLDRWAALFGKRVALVPIDAEQNGEAS
jgi:transcriptional regulator with XRE-family HTH domain